MDFIELLKTRRTIRSFKDVPVPEELVQQLIEAGRLAPSRANSQPWRFIIITDAAIKQQLYEAAFHQRVVLDAPLLIAVLSIIDPRSTIPDRTFELVQMGAITEDVKNFGDHVLDNWNPDELKTDAALNSAIAATHISLAAHALGLGCCWIKLCDDAEVLKILRVPDGYYHAGILAIGYPAEQPGARPRLPASELVRRNTFQ